MKSDTYVVKKTNQHVTSVGQRKLEIIGSNPVGDSDFFSVPRS